MTSAGAPAAGAAAPVLDMAVPRTACVCDVLLDGCSNTAADRRAAAEVVAAAPWLRQAAWQNRSFLRRVVRFLTCEVGVRQVLDLGCGILTMGAAYQLVRAVSADAAVVCADVDQLVVAHGGLVLADDTRAAAVQVDICDPEAVLAHPKVRELLDFDAPIGVLMLDVLPYVADADRAGRAVAGYVEGLPAGSWVAVSHVTADALRAGAVSGLAAVGQVYARAGQPWTPRNRREVGGWLDGLDLVEPGLVGLPWWRPDGGDQPCGPLLAYGAVGRIR